MIEHLTEDNAEIKAPQADGNGNSEFFVEYQRGNIHTAGGRAAPDDDSQGKPQSQSGKESVQQKIVGD